MSEQPPAASCWKSAIAAMWDHDSIRPRPNAIRDHRRRDRRDSKTATGIAHADPQIRPSSLTAAGEQALLCAVAIGQPGAGLRLTCPKPNHRPMRTCCVARRRIRPVPSMRLDQRRVCMAGRSSGLVS